MFGEVKLGEANYTATDVKYLHVKYPGKGPLKPNAFSRPFHKDNPFAFFWSLFCWILRIWQTQNLFMLSNMLRPKFDGFN